MAHLLPMKEQDILVAVGRTIRGFRKEAGLTQPQLADKVGVSLDTIGNLERGGILHCSPDAVQDWASPRPKHGRVVCGRSEEHTSELQSLMRISYAVFCLK